MEICLAISFFGGGGPMAVCSPNQGFWMQLMSLEASLNSGCLTVSVDDRPRSKKAKAIKAGVVPSPSVADPNDSRHSSFPSTIPEEADPEEGAPVPAGGVATCFTANRLVHETPTSEDLLGTTGVGAIASDI
ncbi:hypothetical protein H696_00243 [Fonticula alba]|uniref:Uncharacterized protein n=1 Tax=Fonticula alba TaxID=691883 RepID=A0A058ZFF4_FONAL|nr:hypothetical protein H696_00243 [Fonticula alba]KCV72663.1 hypothetical protein H696_00243 [Fonticula alba]|eukprot:XP_009492364.1 hypothetical protein H696_00243 [Fonticula alba]